MSKDRSPKKLSKKDQLAQKKYESRRRFLRNSLIIGGGAIGVAAGVFEVAHILNGPSLDEDLNSFRHSIEIPNFQLNFSESDKQKFSNEKWLDLVKVQISPDYKTASDTEKPKYLGDADVRLIESIAKDMRNSDFKGFSETGKIFEDFSVPLNQPITKDGVIVKYATSAGSGTGAMFMASQFENDGNNWFVKLIVNVDILGNGTKTISRFNATRVTWASTLVHEIRGHRYLTEKLVNFYISKGKSLNEAVTLAAKDPYQEPYAYAVQASTELALLDLGVAIPNSKKTEKIIDKWKTMNGDWTSPDWGQFIYEMATQK